MIHSNMAYQDQGRSRTDSAARPLSPHPRVLSQAELDVLDGHDARVYGSNGASTDPDVIATIARHLPGAGASPVPPGMGDRGADSERLLEVELADIQREKRKLSLAQQIVTARQEMAGQYEDMVNPPEPAPTFVERVVGTALDIADVLGHPATRGALNVVASTLTGQPMQETVGNAGGGQNVIATTRQVVDGVIGGGSGAPLPRKLAGVVASHLLQPHLDKAQLVANGYTGTPPAPEVVARYQARQQPQWPLPPGATHNGVVARAQQIEAGLPGDFGNRAGTTVDKAAYDATHPADPRDLPRVVAHVVTPRPDAATNGAAPAKKGGFFRRG